MCDADFEQTLELVKAIAAQKKASKSHVGAGDAKAVSVSHGKPVATPPSAALAAPPEHAERLLLGGSTTYTVDELKPYLPSCLVVRMGREAIRVTRWRALVRDVPEPFAFSMQFGGRITELEAVKRMLAFIWAVAKREHGVECPYEELQHYG